MKTTKYVLISLITVLLSGCLVTHTTLPFGAISNTIGNITVSNTPVLNQTTTANIGDVIISSNPVYQTEAIRLDDAKSHHGTNLGSDFELTLPKGIYYLEGTDYRGKFYRFPTSLRFQVGYQSVSVDGGIVIPSDPSNPPHIYWRPINMGNERISEPTADFKYTDTIYESRVNDEFKVVLIYNGISNNQVKFLYKEFIDDMARPAFDQEVVYDYIPNAEIGFKNARFKIISASSTELTYEVTRHLK